MNPGEINPRSVICAEASLDEREKVDNEIMHITVGLWFLERFDLVRSMVTEYSLVKNNVQTINRTCHYFWIMIYCTIPLESKSFCYTSHHQT